MSDHLLPSNPFETIFPGTSLPTGLSQYPASLLTNSRVVVSGNQVRIGFDAGRTDMLMSTNAPRVELRLASDETWNAYVVFKMSIVLTAGVSGKASAGVALYDPANRSSFDPIIELAGTTTPATVYSANDSDTIGATSGTATALVPGSPRWVRLVLIDNVVYAEQAPVSGSSPPATGWVRFDDSSSKGSTKRGVTGSRGSVVFFTRAQDATVDNAGVDFLISALSVTAWPRWAVGVGVRYLQAKTWPEGGRIDLSWINPVGQDAPRWMAIYRSKVGHTEFYPGRSLTSPAEGIGLTGFGEVIYEGVPKEQHQDILVKDDVFYYYSVFATRAPQADTFPNDSGTLSEFANRPSSTDWGPQVLPSSKVTGLAIRRRFILDGEWLYKLFPENYREQDQQDARDLGSSTGYLQRYSRFMQAGIDYMHGHVSGLGKTGDPEKAPLGLVGGAVADQTSIVDVLLRDLGFPASGLDARGKRKLLQFGVKHLKLKGGRDGCCSFIRLVTGWDNDVCIEPGVGLNLRWLRTWDGFTTRENFSGSTFAYPAGKITGLSGLTPGRYRGGLYVDWFGNVHVIADNDATSITFQDQAVQVYKEMLFTGDVTASGVTLTALGTNARLPNDFAFNRGQVMTSGGAAIGNVTATKYAALSALEHVSATGLSTGVGQQVAVAAAYSGASYAARVATHKFWLLVGEPSWLYHSGSDLSLVGTPIDPFYHLWPGVNPVGSGRSYPMTDYDFLVYAPSGAAKTANVQVSAVTSTTVTIGTLASSVLVGDYVNPNRNQERWFRILAISGSGPYVLTVALDGDNTPAQVCTAGDLATIAERRTVEHDRNLRALMPLMLPFDSRLFIYYQ